MRHYRALKGFCRTCQLFCVCGDWAPVRSPANVAPGQSYCEVETKCCATNSSTRRTCTGPPKRTRIWARHRCHDSGLLFQPLTRPLRSKFYFFSRSRPATRLIWEHHTSPAQPLRRSAPQPSTRHPVSDHGCAAISKTQRFVERQTRQGKNYRETKRYLP